MKNFFSLISALVLFASCQNEAPKEESEVHELETSIQKVNEHVAEEQLYFVHNTLGTFKVYTTLSTYNLSEFERIDMNTEVSDLHGYAFGENPHHADFMLQTYSSDQDTIFHIYSDSPEFKLSNGLFVGMTINEALTKDSLLFYTPADELGDHWGNFSAKEYSIAATNLADSILAIDSRDPSFPIRLNQVNNEAVITRIGIYSK